MTYIFENWLKCFKKRPKYVGNNVDLWEMSEICG